MLSEKVMSLILLLSLAVNYPVLKSWNLGLSKLLILAVDDGEGVTAMNLLSNSNTLRLDVLTGNKTLESVLLQTNSDFVLCPYSRSRRGKEFVERLSSIVKTGTVNGGSITALPLVITETVPVELMEQDTFIIFLDGSLEEMPIDRQSVVPPDCQLEVVKDKIRIVTKKACSRDEKIFLSAACFLYPNLVSAGQEKNFDDFITCAKQLVEKNENKNAADLSEAFIRELYLWQERTAFCEIYELPNVEMCVANKIENGMFYDDQFLFMKERLFKSISASLLQIFPLNGLKAALVNDGILCPENAATYTAKMPFYNVAGQYQRERMLRFRRSRLSVLGEMEFVEMCQYLKEDNDGNRN